MRLWEGLELKSRPKMWYCPTLALDVHLLHETDFHLPCKKPVQGEGGHAVHRGRGGRSATREGACVRRRLTPFPEVELVVAYTVEERMKRPFFEDITRLSMLFQYRVIKLSISIPFLTTFGFSHKTSKSWGLSPSNRTGDTFELHRSGKAVH